MHLIKQLESFFAERDGVIVAFSGGVDSAVLAVVAHLVLRENMMAVTGDSPSVPSRDRELTVEFCRRHNIPHRIIRTDEFEIPAYRANAGDRCYFCKGELFRKLDVVRREHGFNWIAEGTNKSDLVGHRPGARAAGESPFVISPYVDLGIDKEGVREMARALELDVAEKPATACLASRVPVGTTVDPAVLRRIDDAENILRDIGLKQLRVRHHGAIARIEVDPAEINLCVDKREEIVEAIRALGYQHVTLDLLGYKRGGGINA